MWDTLFVLRLLSSRVPGSLNILDRAFFRRIRGEEILCPTSSSVISTHLTDIAQENEVEDLE